jgi:hypothetical protein
MNILEAIGARGQIGPRLLGDMGRMVVEDDSDDGLFGVVGIEVLEQEDELTTAVASFDSGDDVPGVQVQGSDDGGCPHPFILMITANFRVMPRLGRQVGRSVGDGLNSRLLVNGNRDHGRVASRGLLLAQLFDFFVND